MFMGRFDKATASQKDRSNDFFPSDYTNSFYITLN